MAKAKLESRVIYDNRSFEDWKWEDVSYELRHFFNGGNWLAVGHVGRWDGCYDAGTTFTNWDWFIGKALEDCDYWRIEETARGHFIVTGWHHDGDIQFEIKRLSPKGAAYLENQRPSRKAHQTAWKSNFMTSLPHYCRKVWGVGA